MLNNARPLGAHPRGAVGQHGATLRSGLLQQKRKFVCTSPDDIPVPERYGCVPNLETVVAAREMTRRPAPFPHVVVTNMFEEAFYEELCRHFDGVLGQGFGPDVHRQFTAARAPHDFYAHSFRWDRFGPFGVFVSRPWIDLLGRIFPVPLSGHALCGLHHHPAGTGHGFVHNDFHAGYFADLPDRQGVTVARTELCAYATGVPVRPDIPVIEAVQGLALIYYLNSPDWSPGDGGETGLYPGFHAPLDSPAAKVPPVNNSLVAFEVAPRGWHAFMANRSGPRNSFIAWYGRRKEEALVRWGRDSVRLVRQAG